MCLFLSFFFFPSFFTCLLDRLSLCVVFYTARLCMCDKLDTRYFSRLGWLVRCGSEDFIPFYFWVEGEKQNLKKKLSIMWKCVVGFLLLVGG